MALHLVHGGRDPAFLQEPFQAADRAVADAPRPPLLIEPLHCPPGVEQPSPLLIGPVDEKQVQTVGAQTGQALLERGEDAVIARAAEIGLAVGGQVLPGRAAALQHFPGGALLPYLWAVSKLR